MKRFVDFTAGPTWNSKLCISDEIKASYSVLYCSLSVACLLFNLSLRFPFSYSLSFSLLLSFSINLIFPIHRYLSLFRLPLSLYRSHLFYALLPVSLQCLSLAQLVAVGTI